MVRATSIIDVRRSGRAAVPFCTGRRAGLTLAESLIAAVVLAIAVVGIMAPIGASHTQARVSKDSSTLASLGRQLMDEIVARPFVDPSDKSATLGAESDEPTRAYFDNVDDFHGFMDSSDGSAGPKFSGMDGAELSIGSGVFKRSVTVQYREGPAGPPAASGDYALVSVVVEAEGGQRLVMQRLVTRYPRK